jgi:hypothetical protein
MVVVLGWVIGVTGLTVAWMVGVRPVGTLTRLWRRHLGAGGRRIEEVVRRRDSAEPNARARASLEGTGD